jgi:hypothetical protein
MEQRSYRIVIEGELDDRFAGAFDGMRLEREAGTTILSGGRDEAELQGLLQRVAGLGLTLISANAVGDPDQPDR